MSDYNPQPGTPDATPPIPQTKDKLPKPEDKTGW